MPFRKGKRWLADWRNENGQRRRKAFNTKSAALAFETRMRKEATAKKAQARTRSGKRRPSGSQRTKGRAATAAPNA